MFEDFFSVLARQPVANLRSFAPRSHANHHSRRSIARMPLHDLAFQSVDARLICRGIRKHIEIRTILYLKLRDCLHLQLLHVVGPVNARNQSEWVDHQGGLPLSACWNKDRRHGKRKSEEFTSHVFLLTRSYPTELLQSNDPTFDVAYRS